jgi:hypothetical protein
MVGLPGAPKPAGGNLTVDQHGFQQFCLNLPHKAAKPFNPPANSLSQAFRYFRRFFRSLRQTRTLS